jgi:hypothetical protein
MFSIFPRFFAHLVCSISLSSAKAPVDTITELFWLCWMLGNYLAMILGSFVLFTMLMGNRVPSKVVLIFHSNSLYHFKNILWGLLPQPHSNSPQGNWTLLGKAYHCTSSTMIQPSSQCPYQYTSYFCWSSIMWYIPEYHAYSVAARTQHVSLFLLFERRSYRFVN